MKVKCIEVCIHEDDEEGSHSISGTLKDLFDEDLDLLQEEIEKERARRELEGK